MRKDNKSGVTGVNAKYSKVTGKVIGWYSQWNGLNGKRHYEYFTLKRYSNKKAKQLAIASRKLAIENLNSEGGDYTRNHGGNYEN